MNWISSLRLDSGFGDFEADLAVFGFQFCFSAHRQCVERIAMAKRGVHDNRNIQIAEMLARMDAKLADPELYRGPADRIEALQKKRGEIVEGQARAEALWLAAEEKLEAAEAELTEGAA